MHLNCCIGFNSYGEFAEYVALAYWRSCIGKGLPCSLAGLFSFPILGGRILTRALQSSPYQNPGRGTVSVTHKGQRTEILVSNFGYITCMQYIFNICGMNLNNQQKLRIKKKCCPSLVDCTNSTRIFIKKEADESNLKFLLHFTK